MQAESSDWQLLRAYVHEGSQEAFAALVERHVNFVYSTCLRETRDATLAEDTTQVVFLILARKAPLLRETGTLSGWLFKTSRFASRNAMNQELRRQRREQNIMQEIVADNAYLTATEPAAGRVELEELLHGALSHLNQAQRNVILLRYFEGKSVRETGEVLGITEKAAERRIAYALEKMRHYFARHGTVVSIAAIAVFIVEDAVQAAPAECAATVLQMAHNVAAGGSVAGTVGVALTDAVTRTHLASLSQGVLKAMLLSQIKTGIVAGVAITAMAASTVRLAHLAMAAQQTNQNATALSEPSGKEPPQIVKAKSQATKRSAAASLAAPARLNEGRPQRQWQASTNPQTSSQTRAPQRPLVRIAQPTLPATKPDEKPAPPASDEKPQAPQGANASAKVVDVKPQAGEITVEGPLVAVNGGRLIVNVTAYALPSGKMNAVNPAKPKTILLNPQTVIHVRGAATPINALALKPDAFVRVVGTDAGTGAALPARDIAVWDAVKDGIYSWAGAPVGTAPVGIAPSNGAAQNVRLDNADPADEPPDDNDAYERPNVFAQGDFQKAVAGQSPPGWTVNPGAQARVVQKDGKRWLSISSAQQGWGTTRIKIALQADWKRVRVAAQLKAKNIGRGAAWWHGARLDFNLYDAKNNIVRYGRGLNLWESGDWTKQSRTIEVPQGATHLVLEAGLFFSSGELLLDNIRIEANAPLEGRPIRAGFPEGTFEKIQGSGWPEGFEPREPGDVKVLEEDGNHFIRFVSQPPGQSLLLDSRFALPREWKKVRVKARVRLKDFIPGKNPWSNARVGIYGEDEWGQRVGEFWKVTQIAPSDEWTTVESINSIPEGTKILRLQPQINGASGIFDVDDIEISDATNDDLPSLPVLPNLPGGSFEYLDDNGWPIGWEKAEGQQVFQVIEEEGNHYLRLSSNEIVYATAKARFQLPPDWRALKLKGRLRVKNLKKKPDAQNWETARVGFAYQNRHGVRTGRTTPSLAMHADGDWKQLELKSNIPPDAAYVELTVLFNHAGGVFDVDDLQLEAATPSVVQAPVYEWTRVFPEGSFEHLDERGHPVNWLPDGKGKVLEEEGNHFLRLSNSDAQSSVAMPSQWKLRPQWKAVHVRARIRGRNLKFTGKPVDGAGIQILFLNGQNTIIQPMAAPLEIKKDCDWVDLQTKVIIPRGAVTIRLVPSLVRTTGILDVDDILIGPAAE